MHVDRAAYVLRSKFIQLDNTRTFIGIFTYRLTSKEKKDALDLLLVVTEMIIRTIKDCNFINMKEQRLYNTNEELVSLSIYTN